MNSIFETFTLMVRCGKLLSRNAKLSSERQITFSVFLAVLSDEIMPLGIKPLKPQRLVYVLLRLTLKIVFLNISCCVFNFKVENSMYLPLTQHLIDTKQYI